MAMEPRIGFWEINAEDGEALTRFYEQLFGWEARHDEQSGIWHIPSGDGKDGGIGGGIFTGKGRLPPHRCLYLEVEDVAATCDRARALGVEILQGPFEAAPGRMLAFFRDPEGHMLGVSGPAPAQP
jgi:predicted enzyme related to lactoylglutathione lyase